MLAAPTLRFLFFASHNGDAQAPATLYVVHAEATALDGRRYRTCYTFAAAQLGRPNFADLLSARCAELRLRLEAAFDFAEAAT